MFSGYLTGLSGEKVHIMGYVTLEITCGNGMFFRLIDVNYLIMDALSSYNIIIGRPALNTLEPVVSTMYLALKYSLPRGQVGTIRGVIGRSRML